MTIVKNSQTKYKKSNLVSEKVDDKEVVLNHHRGTIVTLNPTASEILFMLKTPKSFEEILGELRNKYDLVPVVDIERNLLILEKAGLIYQWKK